MAATVAGILLAGDHASRPAATAPPVGSIYSCSDHALIYVTDGATWSTWATLGSAFSYGTTADMPASAPGDAEAAGSSGKVSDAGHVHGRESYATITAGLTYGTTADMPASAPGDAEAAGASGKVSDAAHVHGREAWGGTGDMSASAIGDTVSAGATGKVADAGHRHARESAASITAALDYGEVGDISASAPGDTAAAGSTGEVADAGHRHARATERVVYEFVIDGGGSVITTGVKGDLYVPDAFTLTGWAILLDQSGSIVIDVWNDTYANYPPTVADSLNAGGGTKPTVTTATKNKDTTLTSYDTSIPADSTLRFNVDSITTATRAVIALFGVRV